MASRPALPSIGVSYVRVLLGNRLGDIGPMWTAEIEQRAITAWNEKQWTAAQIADDLGPPFTRNSVIAKIWRLRRAGVPLRFTPNGPDRVLGAKMARRARQKARELRLEVANRKAARQTTKDKVGARKAQPPPPPVVARDPGYPRIRSVEELEKSHCRWPFGHPGKPDFGFCGANKIEGLPYCPAHALAAFDSSFVRSHPELRKLAPEKEPELVS